VLNLVTYINLVVLCGKQGRLYNLKKKPAYDGTCKAKAVYNLKKKLILSKLQRVNTRPLEGLTCFGLERYGTEVSAVMHALKALMTSAKQYKAMHFNGFHSEIFLNYCDSPFINIRNF
jgi:hypothetical protein